MIPKKSKRWKQSLLQLGYIKRVENKIDKRKLAKEKIFKTTFNGNFHYKLNKDIQNRGLELKKTIQVKGK